MGPSLNQSVQALNQAFCRGKYVETCFGECYNGNRRVSTFIIILQGILLSETYRIGFPYASQFVNVHRIGNKITEQGDIRHRGHR